MIMMMMMVMILLTKAMPNSEFVIRIGSLIIYLCVCGIICQFLVSDQIN